MGRTAEEVIALALTQVGTKECPYGSNNVIFNTDYYGRTIYGKSYPWCVVFVWDIFRMSACSDLFAGGKKTASCTALGILMHKQYHKGSKGMKRGDLVFFNFSGTSTKQHIGICLNVNGSTIESVDGNTGTSNESNGGAVMRRKRSIATVVGYIRPNYDEVVKVKTNVSNVGIWTEPCSLPSYLSKRVPLGYEITVYPTEITGTDGKIYYRTIRGKYVIAKSLLKE